jgi:hypothetical protein
MTPGVRQRTSDEIGGTSDITLNDLRPSKYVELAPGVFATRANNGLINLGIPQGTNEYVKSQACRTIRANNQRLKLLIGCGNWDGPETGAAEGKIGRQGARICLQFSANSQDVHMLRSIPPRLVDEAAGLHDDGVMAATYKQLMDGATGGKGDSAA